MKILGITILGLLFLIAIAPDALAKDSSDRNRVYKSEKPRDQGHGDQLADKGRGRGRDDRRDDDYFDRRHDRDYEHRHPERRPPGYRRHPRDRYHGHPHVFSHREYHYEGHWRSWDDWEKYRGRYRHRFDHGRYYREDGSLFFRFCDPDSGSCFFFSIGR
jgi:hypothetical protein